MSRAEAVDALYQDMAARHRARFRSVHVSFPASVDLTILLIRCIDSESGRSGEDGGCPTPLHQTTTVEGTEIPITSSRCQEDRQEDILGHSSLYIQIDRVSCTIVVGRC